MLYERDPILRRECPKGSVRVSITKATSIGLPLSGLTVSGNVRLDERIDDVIGFRVLYLAIAQEGALTQVNGSLMVLSSNKLGGAVKRPSFKIAIASDTVPMVANEFTNVIGLGVITKDNRDWGFPFSEVNRKIDFLSATPVQDFDWTVQPVSGGFLTPNPFALDLVIEFYTQCQC